MPLKVAAFTAGEFLDEAVEFGDVQQDGFELLNGQSLILMGGGCCNET